MTICNINAVRKSAIKSFPGHSVEYSLAESICSEDDNATSDIAKTSTWQQFRDVLINVKLNYFTNFVISGGLNSFILSGESTM